MAEQPKSGMGDENSTKHWKIEHDFIWQDFHFGSWINKFHSILRCILWYLGENKFLQSAMKSVSWGSMKENVWSLMKECLVFENCVRSLSFLTLKSFHTSQTSMRWKFLETQTKSSQLSKISSKLSLLVSPLVPQS